MAQFGSQEWVDALKAKVNTNKELPKAGKGFDASIQFIVTRPGKKSDLKFWTHMKDGKVIEAVAGDEKKCEFTLTGDYDVWKDIVTGKQDPINAIMLKKLTFQGDMQTVMRYIKAVNLVMESVKKTPAQF